MPRGGKIVRLSAGTGRAFWGPGDMYTFLVTGEQTGGAYFVMEALVPPGGGPPPHIHRNEDETFYIVEGQCSIRLGGQTANAATGDFVNVPRGTVHCFRNEGTSTMRMILTFSPSGIEKSSRKRWNRHWIGDRIRLRIFRRWLIGSSRRAQSMGSNFLPPSPVASLWL
jgi:quercetin dioxygenase-like cupin family protein